MSTEASDANPAAVIEVEPGICGFPCTIKAWPTGKRMVAVEITGSECKQIQRLASNLTAMTLKELFQPMTRNPVYKAAEQSGCHPCCVIPAAILKAVEVALEMALPKDVRIQFAHLSARTKER